jgi:two-component system, NarL family, response regulator DevR
LGWYSFLRKLHDGRTTSNDTTDHGGAVKIRVLVVDDFPLVREGLAAALAIDPGFEVLGQASDAGEGLRMALELRPDVVLLDLRMPEGGGIALLEKLRDELPETRALVVTASEKAEALLDAVAAGAAGYVTKRVSARELRHAVVTVYSGGSIITPTLAGHLLREYSQVSRGEPMHVRPLLGQREQEVLKLVAQGCTDREVGTRLYISPRTVQNHLARIREKTGLRRRSELAAWAAEHSLV